MALIGMRDVCWGFDHPPLLEHITFQIEKGERIGLLGRNGAGKSSLLKLLAGEMPPDSGEIWRQQGTTVALMPQEVPPGYGGTVFDVAARGLGEKGEALVQYMRIMQDPAHASDPGTAAKQNALQQKLDTEDGWLALRQIETVLSRMGLDGKAPFAGLSAGMKRRALLARALAQKPDALLLDEPTNHLDIDSIQWMQEFIGQHVPTFLFITHDRAFLKAVANRIMELDRGRLASYACDYPMFLERRQAELEAEEKQEAVFDKKLSREEAWIRQGIKARRTRNEGRVRALYKMRESFRARRRHAGNVRLQIQDAERTGKLVIDARDLSFAHGSQLIVRNFDTFIMRGDKVGIIGPNGAGKTTLLKLLLKELAPDKGSVRHGTRLQAAYFDQLRNQLEEEKTVQENIAQGGNFITFNGRKRHVIGYLQDFLFTPERCRTPVYVLSGGEKHRLLMARLFTRPANLLVMDEPTNDLDAETLELLEDLLLAYEGTVLLVSHDRTFLNNVVTSTLAFEEEGRVIEYAGGYDDWLSQRPRGGAPRTASGKERKAGRPKPQPARPAKLGYMEARELEAMPQKIESLESEHQALCAMLSDPLFYKREKQEIAKVKIRCEEVELAIQAAYSRWEALETLKSGS